MFCSRCGEKSDYEASFCSRCGAQLTTAATRAPWPDQVQSIKSEQTSRSAGFWYRTLASFIDGIIITIVVIIIALPPAFILGAAMAQTYSAAEIGSVAEAVGNLLAIIINWLYFTMAESSPWQGTLGKKFLGLKVTDEAGKRIGFGRANGRYWSKILSCLILGIGFIMVAFTKKKQGLHDKIAGTLVIKS